MGTRTEYPRGKPNEATLPSLSLSSFLYKTLLIEHSLRHSRDAGQMKIVTDTNYRIVDVEGRVVVDDDDVENSSP